MYGVWALGAAHQTCRHSRASYYSEPADQRAPKLKWPRLEGCAARPGARHHYQLLHHLTRPVTPHASSRLMHCGRDATVRMATATSWRIPRLRCQAASLDASIASTLAMSSRALPPAPGGLPALAGISEKPQPHFTFPSPFLAFSPNC
jgi:hypothetical protein